jgi:hypothetical protein
MPSPTRGPGASSPQRTLPPSIHTPTFTPRHSHPSSRTLCERATWALLRVPLTLLPSDAFLDRYELHSMMLEAVDEVVNSDVLLAEFGIPRELWPSVRGSWHRRHTDFIGRFDLLCGPRSRTRLLPHGTPPIHTLCGYPTGPHPCVVRAAKMNPPCAPRDPTHTPWGARANPPCVPWDPTRTPWDHPLPPHGTLPTPHPPRNPTMTWQVGRRGRAQASRVQCRHADRPRRVGSGPARLVRRSPPNQRPIQRAGRGTRRWYHPSIAPFTIPALSSSVCPPSLIHPIAVW